jgi:hypothetical protein
MLDFIINTALVGFVCFKTGNALLKKIFFNPIVRSLTLKN